MLLRPATFTDSNAILNWRNDPLTRAMSRDHAIVELENHQTWFAKALQDQTKILMIGEIDGRPIGLVRFDQSKDGWEVGINLNPHDRGKGQGVELLRRAVRQFQMDHANQKLIAGIRPENTASRKIFEACGFRWIDRRDELDHFEAE